MALLAKIVLVSAGLLIALAAAAYWYSLHVPGPAHEGPLPPLSADEARLAERLRRHVTAVASEPHNVRYHAALTRAAHYIENELRALGYEPKRQPYDADGRPVWNIEATLEPASAKAGEESLVVGAHYDSAGDAPGANDNGTGVAALIELARSLRAGPAPGKRVHLVFFVNEEPPYFRTELMGSRRYAELLRQRGERVAGMIALETIGAFSDAPGSQRYPAPFHLVLPNVGNFIAFVAMPGSRRFMHEVIGAFRREARFPTIGGVAPAIVEGIDWSDHASFAAQGIPALMITDTAVFRYPHYHTPADTPDKVDYQKLARITAGLARVLHHLAR